ncbi:MAG TPA: hypothetical protein VFB42_11445 [Gaiellaceae bacterium]|nr:hypothetical protein [Gaiellaceae bacterium]
MWAAKARDGVAAVAHGAWGAFWIAFFVVGILQADGTVPTPASGAPGLVFGRWTVGLSYVTWTCALGAAGPARCVISAVTPLAASGKAILPTGELKKAANRPGSTVVHPLELPWAEPGVEHGQ